MIKWICKIFVMTAIFVFASTAVYASHHEKAIMDEFFDAVQLSEAGHYEQAIRLIENIEKKIENDLNNQRTEKRQYVKDVFEHTISVLRNTQLTDDMKIKSVHQLHLVLETLQKEESPMLSRQLEKLTKNVYTALESESAQLQKEYYDVYQQFIEVYPAIKLYRNLDEWLILDHQVLQLSDGLYSDNLEEKEEALHVMLNIVKVEKGKDEPIKDEKKKNSDLSFLWLVFSVGGAIIATLIYVGWRKYKGEKRRSKEKLNS
ncbi:sporulation protein YpjB [Salirhabdus salicampi]|uniref:sporulation protein YpjB n=1 Tax=Salirhabdus salicampi TaxID=476102 RepID=UPI0020C25E23|nr:sporulation protein YpjB [Salirhabdus salicampi]MCP8616685.1 sporulation protein YpjB [Salirhabdus salicampi]